MFKECEYLSEDRLKNLNIPVFIAVAALDTHLDNAGAEEFLDRIQTAADQKSLKSYEYEHVFLLNGLIYEGILLEQTTWLEKTVLASSV